VLDLPFNLHYIVTFGDNDGTKMVMEIGMTKIEEIQAAVESLPESEYAQFRRWFSERDWEKWDKQIEVDSEAGNLDFLVKEAIGSGLGRATITIE
jgi:hypothetical protein